MHLFCKESFVFPCFLGCISEIRVLLEFVQIDLGKLGVAGGALSLGNFLPAEVGVGPRSTIQNRGHFQRKRSSECIILLRPQCRGLCPYFRTKFRYFCLSPAGYENTRP